LRAISTKSLEEQWQLLGTLEALNGMFLFGLTTAFLCSRTASRPSSFRCSRAACSTTGCTSAHPMAVWPSVEVLSTSGWRATIK